MTRLPPIDHADLVAGLRRHGFEGSYPGGKHLFMIKGDLRLTLPNPHRHAIASPLLARLLRQAGITREEWLKE